MSPRRKLWVLLLTEAGQPRPPGLRLPVPTPTQDSGCLKIPEWVSPSFRGFFQSGTQEIFARNSVCPLTK